MNAADAGLLDLPSAIARLRETSFHVTPALLKRSLDRDIERRLRFGGACGYGVPSLERL